MSSETSMVAASFRLQEWAAQIRECQNRPADVSVASWCADHGITIANYYYRLHRVRKACLEHMQEEIEYSCSMKSHFRKFGNQMSGSGNHLCEFTRAAFYLSHIPLALTYHVQHQCL